jgi:hypothetical protein
VTVLNEMLDRGDEKMVGTLWIHDNLVESDGGVLI